MLLFYTTLLVDIFLIFLLLETETKRENNGWDFFSFQHFQKISNTNQQSIYTFFTSSYIQPTYTQQSFSRHTLLIQLY